MNGCCEQEQPLPGDYSLTIAIAGNPNCGKSALFNAFTGIRQRTGNWPGVTVDRKEGQFALEQYSVKLIDLPGIYSLDASSMDEEITRDYLLSREADLIINVVDASNLERNLYLTVQLLEMGVPMVLALNMMDVARKRGIRIDVDKLATELGCPVVPVVATSGEGTAELKARMLAVATGTERGGFALANEEVVEQAVADLEQYLAQENPANRHWLSLKMLESDEHIPADLAEQARQRIMHWRKSIEDRSNEEADIHISDTRFSHAHALAQTVIKERGKLGKTVSDWIDTVVLSRWLGVPVFLFMMYLMFMFTINIGGAFIDFFDGIAGAFAVDGFGHLLTSWGAPEWLRVILADGLGGGLQVVATFIPIIAALYLFLSALEDSGYMARAAFVMDRFMRSIGLPGKAFVPLIVGFGCNVPAIMATRTLENMRERKLTILMNPFMSCGARLPVYVLFAAAFFPNNGQNLVFSLYVIGIVVAILTGLIMKRTLLPGESAGFMMELPPYHVPTLKGVLLRTWDRVKVFIKEAGQIIIVMVLVLNVLNSIGTDGSFGNEDSDKSVLSAVSQAVTPAFAPMGIHEDNWPAVVGIVSGVLAKEVVVGTLDTLYSRLAVEASGDAAEQPGFSLWQAIRDSAATVPENLAGVAELITDPLGLGAADIRDKDITEVAQEQEVSMDVFGAMASRFDGQVGAFAYLLFVLLYFPCAATIGAIKREAGGAWATFVAFWTTSVAYISASVYYQAATWSQHPRASLSWILLLLGFLGLVIVGLNRWMNRGRPGPVNPATEQP
ncbi:MAG TPA: Fe(2+) transporter permease subunit FeoB [Thiolapillus brandeum]|uniref:Ferrous iron transport protein B n=1 Tax=Thiolapillus brandeum TaxID=1076588 RepID=A0A831JQT6_9GAMM|nr:Fe(2+) transporter permease subunit FeoB [Thiolapillus brandeum]